MKIHVAFFHTQITASHQQYNNINSYNTKIDNSYPKTDLSIYYTYGTITPIDCEI